MLQNPVDGAPRREAGVLIWLERRAQRLARALTKSIAPRDVMELLAAAALFAVLIFPLGLLSGLYHVAPRPPREILSLGLAAFFAPACGEELFFRGLLIPDRTERGRAILAIIASTAVFVLWHVVETTFLPGARVLFLRADFLIVAGVLGLICAILRRRSGSIWPAVALHWALVVAWQGFLGGATMDQLGR